MRIVIDMQGAQSLGSRNRGIGRYSTALAKAIIRNRGDHEVILALNASFPKTIDPIMSEFDKLLPQKNICVWQTPDSVCHQTPANNWRRKAAELIREAFLASLQPDIIYITSLFEGLGDDSVTSIGLFTQSIPTAVTLYDLIPLINRKLYLNKPAIEAWYENKLDHLRRADLLLAISDSSRQEGIHYLGFPIDMSVNVGTAADPQFQPIQVTSATELAVRDRYNLVHPFIMYTGGTDHRKNIEGLIRSYALLPKSFRKSHQLAIVCKVNRDVRKSLETLAKKHDLVEGEVILTGYVPEEDLILLYNLCKTFVFPSWHEGFGLPALEAMCCGAPVIGANTSSIPEVIGREDALFDPFDDTAIAEKLLHVLTDDNYRSELIRHGSEQAKKFSWDEGAKRAIVAFEKLLAKKALQQCNKLPTCRPKLAYVSPLPPECSGIADYSAQLIPELSRYYDIEVIVEQAEISDTWIKNNCAIRSVDWFINHADEFERVLYHFGNSQYHQHMFELLENIPGTVVLHDFFLSGIVAYMARHGFNPNGWDRELYHAHGYKALQGRYKTKDAIWKYPCNKSVIENALGIIVHSDFSKRLAEQWYGTEVADDWVVIPLLRFFATNADRRTARKRLGLPADAFVVCSFGLLGPSKLNDRLLAAWVTSPLARDVNCRLVFVGENHGGDYGSSLVRCIKNSPAASRIFITGWADADIYRSWLAAADVGVQLRSKSHGETSASVLDCMNYGLATIVNANGAIAELPNDAVWMLPDEFEDRDLVRALETLWNNECKRNELGQRAREFIETRHSPRLCAEQYQQAIEKYHQKAQFSQYNLVKTIATIENEPSFKLDWMIAAQTIAQNYPASAPNQLLVDISALVKSRINNVIKSDTCNVLAELIANPPEGFRVEPVYAIADKPDYYYARKFTLRFLNTPDSSLEDEPVETFSGDIFLRLAPFPHAALSQDAFSQHLRHIGVREITIQELNCFMPGC